MTKARAGTRGVNGDGSVYWTPSKGWVGAMTLPPNGKRRTVVVKGPENDTKAKREATRKLRDLQGKVTQGTIGTSTTVEQYLTGWLDLEEARVGDGKSKRTQENDRWAIEHWIIPSLGRKKVRFLKAPDIEFLLKEMADQGLSRSSIIRVKSVFGKTLNVAVGRGEADKNWAKLSRMPPGITATTPRRSLTPEQAEILLEKIKGDPLEPLIVLGLSLGMRAGELLGLCWDVVDLDGNHVTISRSLKNDE